MVPLNWCSAITKLVRSRTTTMRVGAPSKRAAASRATTRKGASGASANVELAHEHHSKSAPLGPSFSCWEISHDSTSAPFCNSASKRGRLVRLRPGDKVSCDRADRVHHLVRVARQSFRLVYWHCLAAYSAVVVPCGGGRKDGGHPSLLYAPAKTAVQNNPLETITANGFEGTPLATTKSKSRRGRYRWEYRHLS